MTVISKELFYERVGAAVKCSEIHFWESDCLKSLYSTYLFSNIVKGSAKFFIPIYILKLLLNYKDVKDLELWKNLLISECRSIGYGVCMGYLIVASICILRKISGRLYYYNLIMIPSVLSGLSLLVESKENQILDTIIFFNSFVEAVLKNLNYFDIFKITRTREIIMFVLCSGSLMYLLENRKKKMDIMYFWFYTSPKKQTPDQKGNQVCCHPNNCYKFSFEGFWKYFSLGYMVNMIREFLPKVGTLSKKPTALFKVIFNKANIRFGLFIGSYVGLYRFLTCYLLKTNKINRKLHGLIAGLFSGLTYAISPNIQVLVVGITTVLQLIYEIISDNLKITHHFWQRQILFMICHGVLCHNKMCYPVTCPSYYKNMIDACTNNMLIMMASCCILLKRDSVT